MVKIRLKDGEYYHKPSGYVMIYDPRTRKCMPKHRYLMQKRLGRKLRPDEFVHHKDEIKTHNAPSNLEVESRREHNEHHHRAEKNFYGRNNPSKHIGPSRRAQMRRIWLARKRIYGSTGARNPAGLRRLGQINGRNK